MSEISCAYAPHETCKHPEVAKLEAENERLKRELRIERKGHLMALYEAGDISLEQCEKGIADVALLADTQERDA